MPFDLTMDLNTNVELLKNQYSDCFDVVFHPFLIGGHAEAYLIYIRGLTDVELINQNVLLPLIDLTEKDVNNLFNVFVKKFL